MKGGFLRALSWLALLLAVTASADVVEDLVFEFPEAEAAELPFPPDDLKGPAENTTVPSVGSEASHVKTAGMSQRLVDADDDLTGLSSFKMSSCSVAPVDGRFKPRSAAPCLPPLRM
ncbi:MAG: hypothetical protein AB1555_00505 [Nitrospirota bacterium]